MKPARVALMILILLIAGCARGTNPVAPTEDQPLPGAAVDSVARATESGSFHTLWGWAELRCDTRTGDVELIPVRTPEIHLNVLKPVMGTASTSVTYLSELSDPPTGLFVVDISLTHPFPGKDNLSGFDVKGILITPGTFAVGSLVLAGRDETELLNRDGLTRWWNPTEFTGGGLLGYTPGKPGCQDVAKLTATLNPYKVFADALGPLSPLSDLTLPMLDDPTGRAVFRAGSTNTRRYEIDFPAFGGPVIIFNYAIDASWDLPSPNPPAEVPDDFPISANQPEPFRTQIIFPTNSLEYLVGGSVSGELRVRAEVSDWQGIAFGDIQSQISSVTVYAPTLLMVPVTLDFVTESFDHAVYEDDVTPYLLPLQSDDPHLILVRVETAGWWFDYTQGGINPGPMSPVNSYQTAWVEIASVTCEADANQDFSEAVPLAMGESMFGTLCRPGGDPIDYRDFYSFAIPPEKTLGTIDLECWESPTSLAIFDHLHVKLAEKYVTSGGASIDIGPLGLVPGTYYIRVQTANEHYMVHYDIYNNLTLDPCANAVSFDYETQIDGSVLSQTSIGRRSILVDSDDVWVVYAEGAIGANTIYCRHSSDGGLTFDSPVQVNMLEIACTRLTPSIARDGDGNLYCGWIDHAGGNPEPFVSGSVDGGQSWSLEVSIYDFETSAMPVNAEPNAPLLGTDDSGRVHAVWMDRRYFPDDHIFYSYSDDGGTTWQPAEQVDESPTSVQGGLSEYDLDVSPSGYVVCVWTDRRGITVSPLTSLDVYCDKRDSVNPFGTDVMVNPPDLQFEQTEPSVEITDDDTIHVAWVDRRNDGAFGGSNPWNTWEPYYARSENGGATFIAEAEIPTDVGYSQSSFMAPRITTSPWGNVYVCFRFDNDKIYLSRSCDGGDAWEMPVTVFQADPNFYILNHPSFDLRTDGAAFVLHADTRNDPGPDYTHWNLFLGIGQ